MQAAVNAFNDVEFIEPVRWIDCPVYPTGATQSHFHASDMKTAYTLASLVEQWTAHGITAANDNQFYKGKQGLMVPGWLKEGGSTTPLPKRPPAAQQAERKAYDARYHQHGRHPDTITGSALAVLDIDGMTPSLYARITGTDGQSAAMAGTCGVVYVTASHTPDAPRARVIGILAEHREESDKAAACLAFAKWLMNAAGAVQVAPGRWEFDGQPVKLDKSVYLVNQGIYYPDADRAKMHVFTGAQLVNADLPEVTGEELAAASSSAGAKTATTYAAYNLQGDSLALAEWAAVEGEETARQGEYCFPDHPFHSGEGAKPNSLVLRVDDVAEESCFIGLTDTWRTLKADCKAQGKSVMYATAIGLGMPEDLAARVWGGPQLIKLVADADDFPDLADEEPGEVPETELLEVDNFEGWRDIDLTKAPGLIGAIADDMNRLVFRPLPLATVTGAMQILSMVAALAGTKTPEGGKVCFMSMTIAPSGAGKDLPQAYYQMLAQHIGLGNGNPALKLVFNAPRSDKDVYQSLFENAVAGYPVLFLIVDESQSMLGSASNKQSSEFTQGIIPTLMQMITTPRYKFSGKFIREIHDASAAARKTLTADRKRAIKASKLLAAGKAADMDADEIQKELSRIDNALAYLARRDELAEEGIVRPALVVMMSSTPDEFEKFVNASAIESGLLPRTNVARCDNFRQRSKVSGDFSYEMDSFDPQNPQTEAIIQRLNSIVDGDDFENLAVVDVPAGGVATKGGLVYGAEARELRRRFHEYLEADERLNAPVAGAMYCRGLAQVDTICTLAALDTGEVTPEILRYAFAHVMTSITSAVSIAVRNEERDPMQLLMVDILSYLERKGGAATFVRLKQSVMSRKAMQQLARAWAKVKKGDPFEHALNELALAGKVSGGKGQTVSLTKLKA
ncbi:hypothetical protein [Citrobacter portucalensis]|uniref:hypothetical protein n=1 Tax=Citrobacter portucalensis TaxID=1639133 RepID=UPI0030CD7D68|nr:hypothetical protein [Citrobacter freundii]